jgi:two-component system chemotaxis response regulator CheB
MDMHDIIVIGASAGGVQALQSLVSSLPGDLSAAIFIVLHTRPHSNGLPRVLRPSASLPISSATDGERIECGRIYIAPPDRHLIIAKGHMHLSVGPKENRTRPAINPLFRSAALTYGPRVVGVILTGLLDDGTLGLWEIKRRGGIAIVQEPSEASHPEMPNSAIANVPIDYRVSLREIGPLLVSLSKRPIELKKEKKEATMDAENTDLTCPECHGPLTRHKMGKLIELRCRVGHAFSPENALVAHDESEERSLWGAVQMVEEGAAFAEQLADSLPAELADEVRGRVSTKRRLAVRLRALVEEVTEDKAPSNRSSLIR